MKVSAAFHKPKKQPLSREKIAQIVDAFWRDYFEKHPQPGVIPELNRMREAYKHQ